MRGYYDEIAKGYNELHGEEQLNKLRIIAGQVKIRPKELILDIGCGTGLSGRFFKCRIIGIDPSYELLKRCPFPAIMGEGERLPFKDKSFDIVLCVTALHNFKYPIQGIQEILRVGRKTIVISILKKTNPEKKKEITTEILRRFRVLKEIEEEKDTIYILESKNI